MNRRDNRHPARLLALLWLVAAAPAWAQNPAPRSRPSAEPETLRPRAIVLITVDSLRADAVSLPGQPRKITPYLSSLAYEGAAFSRAYAPSSRTPPSMASLFSGVHPSSHGVHAGRLSDEAGDVVGQPSLDANFTTLAERLKEAGYTTIGVPANRHLSKRLGFGQGFDYYVDGAPFATAPQVNRKVHELLTQAYGTRWRQEWKKNKTFLWIHYFDPHLPYTAREPWIHSFAAGYAINREAYPAGLDESELRALYPSPNLSTKNRLRPLYESEVAFVDEQVRLLASGLELDDPDVALIVTSNHGEELGEHGGLGHGNTLFEEVVRVPLLMRWPEGIGKFQRFDQPVSLLDLYPTIMDLCRYKAPWGLQGESLAPALRGGRVSGNRQLVLGLTPRTGNGGRPWIGLVDSGWKLIRPDIALENSQPARRSRLFELGSDPGERHDASAANPDVVLRLEQSLRQSLEALPEPPSARTTAASNGSR